MKMIVTVENLNNELEKIESEAAVCTLCELCTNRMNPVFARGAGFDFMVCGMIPGPEENKAGSPFVGRSGLLLNRILTELKLNDDVYITNIVKCALTPGISLKQEWIDSCIIYLLAQMELTKPKVIVTLGADATNGLLGNSLDTKIGKLRGKARLYMNTHVVPTYHPSYLLRGGGPEHRDYDKVKSDFELAKFIWQAKIKKGGN